MCGRAAQSQSAVFRAARTLQVENLQQPSRSSETTSDATSDATNNPQTSSLAAALSSSPQRQSDHEWKDNFNMSPGMDCMVFFKDGNTIRAERKIWGLLPRGGSKNHPLPSGMNKFFQAQMYNARSDTLYQKSFSRLAGKGQSCLVALDGFFEWKESALKGDKRQPYFVHRKNGQDEKPYLLMAGLWNRIPTGQKDESDLETFTIITTDACSSLQWLHHRMPVCVWNEDLGRAWLQQPTEATLRKLESESNLTPEGVLGWHAVTTKMSSVKFRSAESLQPLPKMKTVKSFFTVKPKTDSPATKTSDSSKKRASEPNNNETSPAKKSKVASAASKSKDNKKGTIESYFSPKT